jgi:hypothetical protein
MESTSEYVLIQSTSLIGKPVNLPQSSAYWTTPSPPILWHGNRTTALRAAFRLTTLVLISSCKTLADAIRLQIDIRQPSDVTAALVFSKLTGVALTVKNTGHDYKGRSSMKGALGLWTHNLKGKSYNPTFVPAGCSPSTTYTAMTVGAGEGWQDVYEWADSLGVTAIGGYHQTVGASGGWLTGGGHSVLSPVYGLGVDRVVQFRVVTPDGIYRTASACQNQDLFWALRGGGGHAFGVVIESSSIVEPKPVPLQV